MEPQIITLTEGLAWDVGLSLDEQSDEVKEFIINLSEQPNENVELEQLEGFNPRILKKTFEEDNFTLQITFIYTYPANHKNAGLINSINYEMVS